jgi:hypothetical protein
VVLLQQDDSVPALSREETASGRRQLRFGHPELRTS